MTRLRSFMARLALLGAIVLMAPPALTVPPSANPAGKQTAPEASHPQKAQLLAELLTQYHYRELALNDELSSRVLDAYINALDQERYYFLAEDIASFERFRTQLDDDLRRGRLDSAYEVFRVYQQRVKERSDFALSLLSEPLDFSGQETLELDRSKAPWAKTKAELDDLWRRRVKNDALMLKMASQEPAKVTEILGKRYQRLARTVEDYSAEEVFQTYMNAWAQNFDPHTSYMSPRLSESFDIHMRLSLEGIGAMLRSDNDLTEVVELVPGGPAAKSGQLAPGDRIIGVGEGDSGDIIDVVGWRLSDVVDLIRGPKQTTVRLQVLPKHGGATPKIVTLIRNQVQLEEQAAKAKTIEIKDEGVSRKIGVITLPAFYVDFAAADAGAKDYRSTTRDVRRLIEDLKKQGIDGLVLDLRGNGGGSLREATDLVGLFIDHGPVVQVRRNDGGVEVQQDRDRGTVYSGPLAVLVDRYSASASEIVAAAIQDYGRGVVIGQKTFGKGTVQTLIDLDRFGFKPPQSAGRLKLTIAKFYRINGASTQRKGVMPDIVLPSPVIADLERGEDSVETALPWDEIRPVSYRPEGDLSPFLPLLRERHEARTSRDPAFQALLEEYEQMRAIQSRKTLVLNEKIRAEERAQLEATQLQLINRRLKAYGKEPITSLEGVDLDKQVPDTVLETAAAVVADLSVLQTDSAAAKRWLAEHRKTALAH